MTSFIRTGEISLKDAVTVLHRICSAKKNDTKIDNLEAVVSELGIKSQLNGWEKEAFAYALKNKFLTEVLRSIRYRCSKRHNPCRGSGFNIQAAKSFGYNY